MTDDRGASQVAAIHATGRRGAITVTGGGGWLLGALLTTPGASATVLEATVPYCAASLREFLGATPPRFCADETARWLAMRSFLRARALGGDFGFAVTAALATTRERLGTDRAHIAFQDATTTRAWTLVFNADGASAGEREGPAPRAEEPSAGERQGPAPRMQEERELAVAGLSALAHALGVGDAPNLPGVSATGGPFAALMLGERSRMGTESFDAVLPGAFNPLHEGHRAMRADAIRRLAAGRATRPTVAFEFSLINVDKPPVDYVELRRRLAQFRHGEIVVTNAPTFVAKARALGGVVFVVGADTMARIAEPRYYGGPGGRARAFDELRELGCSFLVYGRARDGVFITLEHLDLPPALAALCVGVPETAFRHDESSTALRHEATPLGGRIA